MVQKFNKITDLLEKLSKDKYLRKSGTNMSLFLKYLSIVNFLLTNWCKSKKTCTL